MPNARDDLRATSDSILSDAERLISLEERKRRLDPEDAEVRMLSVQIEELSRRVHKEAKAEREIAEELQTGS